MIRRAALVVAATLIGGLAIGARSYADDRTCILDPVSGLLQCTLVASPQPPITVRLSVDLPLEWRRIPLNVNELIARGHGCTRSVAGVTEIGVGYAITLSNAATLEQLYLRYVCTWPGDPPPPPPLPPPTMAEFVDAKTSAMTLQPDVSPSLAIGGLTGLASWLWCADPGPVGTAVTLRGWTASGAVQVVEVGWEMNGADGVAETSTSCGSQNAPSVTWTPQTAGQYSVVLTSVWAGSWDLSYDGADMGTFPLGPVPLTAPAQPYPVDEYRGELTG
ncbi:MAG: hypothetical protein JWM34_3319 [Ilumatobacteraceae bacterium]|nr:hypothetical protein [Ilumatobacteraceae bacterium]